MMFRSGGARRRRGLAGKSRVGVVAGAPLWSLGSGFRSCRRIASD